MNEPPKVNTRLLRDEETGEPIPQGSSPTPHCPVFDKVGMISRLMGDEDLAKTVVALFLDDIPRQIAALKGHLQGHDAAGAERQAHSINGASANVGGEALRAVACEMEKAAKAGDLPVVTSRMPELKAQFDRLKKEIKPYLAQG